MEHHSFNLNVALRIAEIQAFPQQSLFYYCVYANA